MLDHSANPSWDWMLGDMGGTGALVEQWGDAATGVRLARTTAASVADCPESSLFVDEDVVAVLDGRLNPAQHSRGDAARLVDAYRRHGTHCAKYLSGEFAFVLWDRTTSVLLAGCDPVGIRALAYFSTGRSMFLCSRALVLFREPRVPRRLNAVYLAHTLCDLWAQPPGLTPFASVKRIRPGFALLLRDGQLTERRVDRIAGSSPEGRRWTADRSIASFWDHLEEAVRDALSGEGSPALELSGGLDSTAVALCALKSRASIGALSALASASGVDEGDIIRGFVFTQPRLRWHPVDCSGERAFGEPWECLPVPDDPCAIGAAFLPAKLRLAQAARALGYRLLLDGEGGDEIFGMSPRLGDLVATGSLRAAARYLTARGWRSSLVRELLIPSLPGVFQRLWAGRERRRVDPIPPWMSKSFRESEAVQVALDQRAGWLRHIRARNALPGLLELAPTVGSRQATRLLLSAVGVRSRSPLLERRFLELALSLPPALLSDGSRQGKPFLRRALDGRAPRALVREPKSNGLYLWFQTRGFKDGGIRSLCTSVAECAPLRGLIDLAALARTLEVVAAGRLMPSVRADQLGALVAASRWLTAVNVVLETSGPPLAAASAGGGVNPSTVLGNRLW